MSGRDSAVDILAREMQAIVAADRWKGRSLTAEPPQKWSHLRPETQQFWRDTASRIIDRIAPMLTAHAVAKEREACARIIDDNMLCGIDGPGYHEETLHPRTNPGNKVGSAYASAIRDREPPHAD